MTGRELVSLVRSMHKLLNTDSLLTDRAIIAEIRSCSLLLIKREADKRKLWATDTIFSVLPCLEMIEVPISECCEYVDPCMIARSKYKLPRVAEGNYQYIIQGVYSINALGGKGTKIKEISVNRFINLLRLPVIKKEMYFWITNEYLYVTNPLIEKVRFVALFEEDIPNEMRYPECNCGTPQVTDDEWCMNPLDREFPVPGYLEKQTLDLVSQSLLRTYFAIKSDVTENGVDGQAPNAQPNA